MSAEFAEEVTEVEKGETEETTLLQSESELQGKTPGQEEAVCFTRLLKNKDAFVGETVDFQCEMTQTGLEVTWLKNSEPLSIADSRYQIINRDTTYQLVIPSVTADDSGQYTVKVGDLQSTGILTVYGQYSCQNLCISLFGSCFKVSPVSVFDRNWFFDVIQKLRRKRSLQMNLSKAQQELLR